MNTDTSTRTFTLPEGYRGVFIQFYAANVESDFGYIDANTRGCNLEVKQGEEKAAFGYDESLRVVTILIQNKTAYQKQYGNFVNYWGVR